MSGTQTTEALAANATYTLTCTGIGGSANQSAAVTVTSAPTVTMSASPANVASGGSSTLTWSSAGVTTCTAGGGWSGSKTVSGTAPVGPLTQDTTYSLSCSGSSGSALAMASVTVRVATISWTAPTQYTDGSALTAAGFRIYYSNVSGTYSQSVTINNAATRQLVLPLAAGTWFFVVTALDAAGKESVHSNEASKTIN